LVIGWIDKLRVLRGSKVNEKCVNFIDGVIATSNYRMSKTFRADASYRKEIDKVLAVAAQLKRDQQGTDK